MALIIGTWWWGDKYGPHYVDRLAAGVKRWYRKPYRWLVFRPDGDEDQTLAREPGCFIRLRMFDPAWQIRNGIARGDRIVCMDLDSIVTGPLEPLFMRSEPFVILKGCNAINPCPFNGSLMMLEAGRCARIWEEFSLEAAAKIRFHEFPDDQGWLWHKIPNAASWEAGRYSGVYGFKKPGWPSGDDLPADARMVVFPGWRDPSRFLHLPWVQQHWARIQ